MNSIELSPRLIGMSGWSIWAKLTAKIENLLPPFKKIEKIETEELEQAQFWFARTIRIDQWNQRKFQAIGRKLQYEYKQAALHLQFVWILKCGYINQIRVSLSEAKITPPSHFGIALQLYCNLFNIM